MKHVYLFNPECDLALAHEMAMRQRGVIGTTYTPKPRAFALAHSLAVLPAWYAPAGSCVLVGGGEARREALQRWCDDHGRDVTVINRPPDDDLVSYHPWGWCYTTCHQLLTQGAKPDHLPLQEAESASGIEQCTRLDVLSMASSRRNTVAIHKRVTDILGRQLCPTPVEADAEGVTRFIEQHPQGCYLKKLWSGSGQGIYRVRPGTTTFPPDLTQWLDGELRKTGSVMCEVAYDRLMDMAVEYHCCEGKLEVVGYAVFNVDAHHQWESSEVDTMDSLLRRISSVYPCFGDVVDAVTQALSTVVPSFYGGFLGVDMLLYLDSDGNVAINPCVEVNLRTTMGLVAAKLPPKVPSPSRLRIIPTNQFTDKDWPLTPPDNVPFVAVVTP